MLFSSVFDKKDRTISWLQFLSGIKTLSKNKKNDLKEWIQPSY